MLSWNSTHHLCRGAEPPALERTLPAPHALTASLGTTPVIPPNPLLAKIFNITAVLRPCVEGMHGPLTGFCGTVSADLRAGSLVWLRISKGLEGWFLVMSMTDLEIEEAASTRQAAPVVRWPARVKPHARGHRDPGVRTPLRKPARNGQSPGEADRPLGNLMTGRDEVRC
jgi:hypothetical protein